MTVETHTEAVAESTISLESIAAAIEEFARAAKQTYQYPAHHPMMEAALERARQALLKLFPEGSVDSVRLSTSRQGLMVNEELLPKAGSGLVWLNKDLRERLAKALFFRPGLQVREVESLLQLLSTEPKDIVEKGGVSGWLINQGVRNIEVEQQDYRRLVRESEAALLQMTPQDDSGSVRQMVKLCMGVLESKLEGAIEDEIDSGEDGESPQHSLPARLSWLLDFISATPSAEASAEAQAESVSMGWETLMETEITPSDFLATGLGNLIQVSFEALGPAASSAKEDASRSKQQLEWRKNLVQILRQLERELRARLFRVPIVISPGHEDALISLSFGFSPEEIVDEIVFAHPVTAAEEASSTLTRLLRRIMPTSSQQAEIESLLKERFLQSGMPEETYRNVIGLVLDNLTKEQVVREGESGILLREEEASMLDSLTPVDLSDLTVTLRPEEIEHSHTEMLFTLLQHECSPAQYAGLCAEISAWAKRWQEVGDKESALRLLRALAKETKSADRPPSYRLIATSALGRLDTPEFVSWLPETLPSVAPEERVELLNLLVRLGENAGHALLQFIFNEPDDDLVRTAALAICQTERESLVQAEHESTTSIYDQDKNGGPAEKHAHIKSRLAGMLSEALINAPADRALRIVKLLLSSKSQEAVEPVMAALRHPQARVITGIMQAVGKYKPPGGEKILFAGLKDGYWDVRTKATRALGAMAQDLPQEAAREAVRELSRMAKQLGLNARVLSIRITAIEALGRLGQEEAIPLLLELLEMPGWLFVKARARISSTAAAALVNISSPKAADALKAGAASRRSWVAKNSQVALARWRERWGKGAG